MRVGVMHMTGAAYAGGIPGFRPSEWGQGLFFCCFDGCHALVNGQPIEEWQKQSIENQFPVEGEIGVGYFDLSGMDFLLAALARRHIGNIIFVRVAETGVTGVNGGGVQALLDECREALE